MGLSQYMVHLLFGMQHGSRIADASELFIYDIIKIFLFLLAIVYVVSVIKSYFPPERTKRILSHKKEFIGNILAALLGVVTPFCSCSAVPLFIGFVNAGVPLGVTFSFLSFVTHSERGGAPLGSLRLDHLRVDHRQAEARKMG
jgi:uncharacterized membrane protein YraQ (UPF0718 family)